MAKTNVQIELGRPTGPYYAGDTVQATITLQAEKELPVRGASAYLILQEEYEYKRTGAKGHTYTHKETEESVLDTVNLEKEGTLPVGSHRYPATFQIPDNIVAPFAGKITKNRLLVKATFDSPKALDPEAEIEVPLIVPPPGQKTEPGEYGQEQSEEVDLRLWLPRLEWIEGEKLEGKVLVQPLATFSASEVRVELLLTEDVPRANGNTHIRHEGKEKLAEKVDFWPAHPAEYPFVLPIPTEGQPTRSTGHSTTTWSIKATLARRLRRDTEISVDIEVFNGPARG